MTSRFGIFATVSSALASLVLVLSSANATPLPTRTASDLASRLATLDQPDLNATGLQKTVWTKVSSSRVCTEYKIDMKVGSTRTAGGVGDYSFSFYLPNGSATVPVVIEVPTIEGVTMLQGSLTKHFCKKGLAFVVAQVQPDDMSFTYKDPKILDAVMREGVWAVRTLIDELALVPQPGLKDGVKTTLDMSRLGMFGLSNGTYHAALVAAIDPRVSSVLLYGSIGNAPLALAFSENETLRDLQREMKKSLNLKTNAELELRLQDEITISPVDTAPLLKNKRVQLTVIDGDVIAPADGQLELETSLAGGAQFTSDHVSASHEWAIISAVMFHSDDFSDFFLK